MASHHVLLLGGSGRISQFLTPLLLKKSWTVTSIIRNPDQVANLQKLGENLSGKLNVLVRSVEDVQNEGQAKSIIDEIKPDYVVWSAGAGGKGPAERTFAVDRDAASYFIRASASTPSVTKFVMVSFLGSRRLAPPWWTEEQWQTSHAGLMKVLGRYYEAKIAADEVLYNAGKERADFAAVDLRPHTLSDEPAGKVMLGKVPYEAHVKGKISRESVAEVAAALLENERVKSGWLDLLDGDEDVVAAVDRCVKEGVNCAEGEPFY